MSREHRYAVQVRWTGDRGQGTRSYRAYSREHEISGSGKVPIPGSSDPAFRGDPTRYNPEELLVSSLSACHMLWYLHLCAEAGIVVRTYSDSAEGTLEETADGGGSFREVVLRPVVVVQATGEAATEVLARAEALHGKAHGLCFIANSVSFPVRCEPRSRLVRASEGQSST